MLLSDQGHKFIKSSKIFLELNTNNKQCAKRILHVNVEQFLGP